MHKLKACASILFLFSLLIALISAFAYGQQGTLHFGGNRGSKGESGPAYDPAQAVVVSGEVVEVRDIEMNEKISGEGLLLATSAGDILVFLGPHIYVDFQHVNIEHGDKIDIKGVNTIVEGQSIFLAGEVIKGFADLQLRDDKGQPLWRTAGSRRGKGGWN